MQRIQAADHLEWVKPARLARRDTAPREVSVERSGILVQDSEQALVPVASELAGPPPVSDGWIDVPRLLVAAAFGLAVEAQRRSLDAAGAVVGRFRWPLQVLTRPAAAVARESVAVARHHLNLDGWAARGLAEQRHAQEVAVRASRALIAAMAAAVLDELDLDQVVARVDLNRIVERIDLDAIARRIDLDGIVERVDVDAVAARIDVDAIAGRIDLDAVLGGVDLDAVVARIDLAELTEQVIDEVDLGEIIRESSSTMASETVDALRVQGMRVDGLVSRLVDRVLLRQGQRQTGRSPSNCGHDPGPLCRGQGPTANHPAQHGRRSRREAPRSSDAAD
jgi:hypothetical protein